METIFVERTITGVLVLTAILDDLGYFKRRYIDYTESEARAEFRRDVKAERSKIVREIAPKPRKDCPSCKGSGVLETYTGGGVGCPCAVDKGKVPAERRR